MKKLHSMIMMIAMMVASLSLTACNGDDEDGISKWKKTLTIDGESYYCSKYSKVSQSYGWESLGDLEWYDRGMYLTICAIGDTKKYSHYVEKNLTIVLPPSRVSMLKVGDVFDYDRISVRNFNNYNEIVLDTYNWDAISGNITIREITETTLTIQINKLVIESHRGAKRTIDGIATLTNSLSDSNGNVLPFSYNPYKK